MNERPDTHMIEVETELRARELGQWFTPAWAAEAIIERHYPHLDETHFVAEPSCGKGAFLSALPWNVRSVGFEIDPALACMARARTGREVICADFLKADLPEGITTFIGNPPFNAQLIEAFMDRAYQALPRGGEVGFVLPAYIFQTTSKVLRYAQRWSVAQELMPRNLFPGIKMPLMFARFTKDGQRRLIGFFLYRETADIAALSAEMKAIVNERNGKRSVWRQVVHAAFDQLPAVVHMRELYDFIGKRRPTRNPEWEAQVRKVLSTSSNEFERVERGRYRRRQHLVSSSG